MPTIAIWPGTLPAGKGHTPLHITDWMPTLCALAGHTPRKNPKWVGANVWPVLAEKAALAPRPLYWTALGFRSRAVQLGDWKLIAHGDGPAQRLELFNLASDPSETTNLAAKSPEKLTELTSLLAQIARADRDALAKD